MTKVGFIGLGSQGAPIARRIVQAGYPLVLWARRQESLTPFADTAAETAASIAELGARCEHVGICVVNDADLKQVCDQLIPSMRVGSCIAVHSTVHPTTVIELAKVANARGIALVDAPVSGGSPAAVEGTLTVMVGSTEQDFDAARPIFATFGRLIVRLGDVGAGQMAKLINNTLMAAHLATANHAIVAGKALGIDKVALSEIINASSGRSFAFEVYARMPSPATFSHGAKLLDKDARLLGKVLSERNQPSPLGVIAEPFFDLVNRAQTNA